MKKLPKTFMPVLIALLLLPGLSWSMPSKSIIIEIYIKIRVEFGRMSKDCKGFGLCIVVEDKQLEVNARMGYSQKENILQIEFPEAMVKDNPDQFEGEVFRMDEDFEMSAELSEVLGSSDRIIIPKGKYQGEWIKDSFVINVNL